MKKLIITLSSTIFFLSLFSQSTSLNTDLHGNTTKVYKSINQYAKAEEKDMEWYSYGPYGGDVLDIAVSATNTDSMFAAAGYPYAKQGIDNEWMLINSLLNLAPSGIHCIESAGNVMIAGGNTMFGKIYRSTDSGISWEQKIIPYNGGILDIATDPTAPGLVYACLSTNISVTQNKVIAKSTDYGAFWELFDMTSILPVGWSCVSIAIDPDNSETLFAIGNESFSNAKVIASFDGGATWQDVTSNLPGGKPLNVVAIHDETVYIGGGQLFGGNVLGLYKSDDFGTGWQNISSGFPNKVVNDILINPDDGDNIFVATEGDGVYFTTDGGSTWTYNTSGSGDNGSARCLTFEPGNTDVILAGFLSLGVCYSEDGGETWMDNSKGIASLDLNDIEIDPNDPDLLISGFEAENSGGCYIYDPDWQEWQLVENLPATRFSKVSVGIDGTMYAWSNGPTTVAQEGLYKSTDGGETWENTGPFIGPVFETQIFALALSETDPDLIYIGGNNFGANGWESMIYKTTDGGENWENIFMGPENDSFKYIHIVPGTNDQVLYAAYKSDLLNGVIMKSIDGGNTWLPINTGIPAETKWGGAVVTDPANSDIVYAGVGGYGGIPGSIYQSDDGGNTWSSLFVSLQNYSKFSDFLISPVNSDVMYAATTLEGVFFTEDGQNWTPFNDGLPASNITAFSRAFETTNDWRFYASTFGNSSFWSPVFGTLPEDIEDQLTINTEITAYPNPGKGILKINGLDPEKSYKVSVYTSQGKLLKTFRNTFGNSPEIYIGSKTGLYFLELKSGKEAKWIKVNIL
ncbi:MAG: T9SS type A sorting domain-containing protein [Bacteroidales bacterium]|nr:T9SS type A sorting domain-containing protein [Bacteroidales bacterium]